MGRACSKVAPQEISSPSSLQYVNSSAAGGVPSGVTPQVLQDLIARLAPETGPLKFLTNRLQLKIQEIQVGKAYADVKPPHEQIFNDPPQLTNSFNFYVSIYELRIRGLLQNSPAAAAAPPLNMESSSSGGVADYLPLAQQLSTNSHVGRRRALSGTANGGSSASPSSCSADFVALVSWDNNNEFIRTTFERLDEHGTLRFPGHWNFLWCFEGQRLADMRDRFLLIALFRLEHLRNASLIGYSTIDILSITVGPIHHDFAFHRWGGGGSGVGGGGSGGGSGVGGGGSGIGSGHGSPPQNQTRVQFECRTTQICNLSCIPVEVRVSIEGNSHSNDDGTTTSTTTSGEPNSCGTPPAASTAMAGGNPSTPSSPDTPQTANQTLNLGDSKLSSQEAGDFDDTTTTTIPPKSKSVSNLGTRQSSKISQTAPSAGVSSTPPMSSVTATDVKSLQKKVSVITEVDELDVATTKHHQGDDEKCLVKSEWKVDFAVSGIANAVPSASTWTSVTTEPYWLALDSTAQAPKDRKLYVKPVANDGPIIADTAAAAAEPISSGDTTRPFPGTNRPQIQSLSNPGSGRASLRGKQQLMSGSRTTTAAAAGGVGGSLFQRNGGESSSGISSPLSQKLLPIQKIGGAGERQEFSSAAATHHLQHHPQHGRLSVDENYQGRYRELALTCQSSSVISFAKSALSKNSCLQPFYLRTTSEGIRQYYLLVRLWHKPLGVGSAKLYAETLVPFFKLFDADVVTSRSFFDAQFSETLWSDGRNMGEISAVLVFQDIPVLRQMFAGISTENGYHRLISPTMLPTNSQLHVTPEVALLAQLTRELERHWLRTNVMHAEKVREVTQGGGEGGGPQSTSQKNNTGAGAGAGAGSSPLNISDINDKLIELLSRSSISGKDDLIESSTPMFQYPNVNCLMEGQKTLLELGNHILISQDFLPWSLRGALGNILILILKRGELEMGNVLAQIPKQFQNRRKEMLSLYQQSTRRSAAAPQSLLVPDPSDGPAAAGGGGGGGVPGSPPQQVTTSSTIDPIATAVSTLGSDDLKELSNHHKRMQISLSYAKFLFKLLECANEKIQSEAMFESQRKQIASYYAFLYNRIPALRSKILQTVLTDEERDLYIIEWRGIEFGLDRLSLIQRDDWSKRPWPGLYELQLVLDWNPFYQALNEYYGSDDIITNGADTQPPSGSGSASGGGNGGGGGGNTHPSGNTTTSNPPSTTTRGGGGGGDCESNYQSPIWQDPKDRIEQIFEDQPKALNWLRPRSFTFFLFLNSLMRLTWSQLDYSQQKKLAANSSGDLLEQQQQQQSSSRLRHNLVTAAAPARMFFQRNGATPTTTSEHDLLHSVSGAKGSVTRAALANLRWDLIPGYASLLKAFMIELRDTPVNKFSDALLNCSATLLVNDRLLAVFMRIILNRTSVFSRDQVFSAFNYLDFWFEVFTLKNLALPLTMDYRLLSKAIEAVINSDLALQTAKTLWFLYKRMDLFLTQKPMLKILADLLLYKHSHKLLLHWSWLVRKCFTHLLLYRVCENARKLVAKNSIGDPPQLGIEERLILWSYILVSETIKPLGVASVFPEKFSTVSIRRLLGQPLPAHQQHAYTTLIWNLPAVLNTVTPNTPTKVPPLNTLPPTPTIDTPIIDDARKSINSPMKDPGRSWIIRRPTAFKFRKRKSAKDPNEPPDDDDVLQDPTGEDDVPVFEYEPPEPYLPTIAEPTPQMTPYIQHIIPEFASEVEQYKVWVISGKAEVPPMHIPASPLDTNVDVPLEVD